MSCEVIRTTAALPFLICYDFDLQDVEEPSMCENVVNEIFEMVRPECSGKVTRQDLDKSGKAGDMFGILADMLEFWRHENGEGQSQSELN